MTAGSGSLGGQVGTVNTPRAPALTASLERRLAGTTWLTLDGALSNSVYDEPVTPVVSDGPLPSRDTIELGSTHVALLLGVRQAVTSGIVDVAFKGALGIAHDSVTGEDLQPNESASVTPGSSGTTFGVIGGFDVERELVPSLSLRLTVDVAGVTFSKTTTASQKTTTTPLGSQQRVTTYSDLSARSVSLLIAPGLQLQLYF